MTVLLRVIPSGPLYVVYPAPDPPQHGCSIWGQDEISSKLTQELKSKNKRVTWGNGSIIIVLVDINYRSMQL